MKSTSHIHEIVERFGGENKPELMKELKTLRKATRKEVASKFRATLESVNLLY